MPRRILLRARTMAARIFNDGLLRFSADARHAIERTFPDAVVAQITHDPATDTIRVVPMTMSEFRRTTDGDDTRWRTITRTGQGDLQLRIRKFCVRHGIPLGKATMHVDVAHDGITIYVHDRFTGEGRLAA